MMIYFNQTNNLGGILGDGDNSNTREKMYRSMRYRNTKKDDFVFKYGMTNYLLK